MNETPMHVPPSGAQAAGTDAPEVRKLRVGFLPLTDCAPVLMAAAKGFDRKHGIEILPRRQASWAAVRDGLCDGRLDAAQLLYGMAYGLELGIGGVEMPMAVLMTLNQNGQGISLARRLSEQGVVDGASLARAISGGKVGRFTFAQTFPTGTHALWLYYWLAAHGIHPLRDVRTIVVPPPEMIAECARGRMQGFCVGEPWNRIGAGRGISFQVAGSDAVWPNHPDKVLAATGRFVDANPNAARALVAAVLEAARWIEAAPANLMETAAVLATDLCIGVDSELIVERMTADVGRTRFHLDGEVNFPYLSDGMWFLTQFRRWGLLNADPDYAAVAGRVHRHDIYRDAAAAAKVAVPATANRGAVLIDGRTWDGGDPAAYARAFEISALRQAPPSSPFDSQRPSLSAR
jgi:nitrate/nitrite transport system substrate-binding protein